MTVPWSWAVRLYVLTAAAVVLLCMSALSSRTLSTEVNDLACSAARAHGLLRRVSISPRKDEVSTVKPTVVRVASSGKSPMDKKTTELSTSIASSDRASSSRTSESSAPSSPNGDAAAQEDMMKGEPRTPDNAEKVDQVVLVIIDALTPEVALGIPKGFPGNAHDSLRPSDSSDSNQRTHHDSSPGGADSDSRTRHSISGNANGKRSVGTHRVSAESLQSSDTDVVSRFTHHDTTAPNAASTAAAPTHDVSGSFTYIQRALLEEVEKERQYGAFTRALQERLSSDQHDADWSRLDDIDHDEPFSASNESGCSGRTAKSGKGNNRASEKRRQREAGASRPVVPPPSPPEAVAFISVADAPTTTSQRLKALTTGVIPAFIEAGSNFNSDKIEEDNLIEKLKGRAAVLGDDTWLQLFPDERFWGGDIPDSASSNDGVRRGGDVDGSGATTTDTTTTTVDKAAGVKITRRAGRAFVYPSFDVRDLHTVDNGVLRHLDDVLDIGTPTRAIDGVQRPQQSSARQDAEKSDLKTEPSNTDDADDSIVDEGPAPKLVVAHFLGVDHAGHRYHADHEMLHAKASQLNAAVTHIGETLRRRAQSKPMASGRHTDSLESANKRGSGAKTVAGATPTSASPSRVDSHHNSASGVKTMPGGAPKRTLLIVMGDHGMTQGGDHGGASPAETETFLFAQVFAAEENWSSGDVITRLFSAARTTEHPADRSHINDVNQRENDNDKSRGAASSSSASDDCTVSKRRSWLPLKQAIALEQNTTFAHVSTKDDRMSEQAPASIAPVLSTISRSAAIATGFEVQSKLRQRRFGLCDVSSLCGQYQKWWSPRQSNSYKTDETGDRASMLDALGVIRQIDLAPTLALLFDAPIPHRNVGAVIPEILAISRGVDVNPSMMCPPRDATRVPPSCSSHATTRGVSAHGSDPQAKNYVSGTKQSADSAPTSAPRTQGTETTVGHDARLFRDTVRCTSRMIEALFELEVCNELQMQHAQPLGDAALKTTEEDGNPSQSNTPAIFADTWIDITTKALAFFNETQPDSFASLHRLQQWYTNPLSVFKHNVSSTNERSGVDAQSSSSTTDDLKFDRGLQHDVQPLFAWPMVHARGAAARFSFGEMDTCGVFMSILIALCCLCRCVAMFHSPFEDASFNEGFERTHTWQTRVPSQTKASFNEGFERKHTGQARVPLQTSATDNGRSGKTATPQNGIADILVVKTSGLLRFTISALVMPLIANYVFTETTKPCSQAFKPQDYKSIAQPVLTAGSAVLDQGLGLTPMFVLALIKALFDTAVASSYSACSFLWMVAQSSLSWTAVFTVSSISASSSSATKRLLSDNWISIQPFALSQVAFIGAVVAGVSVACFVRWTSVVAQVLWTVRATNTVTFIGRAIKWTVVVLPRQLQSTPDDASSRRAPTSWRSVKASFWDFTSSMSRPSNAMDSRNTPSGPSLPSLSIGALEAGALTGLVLRCGCLFGNSFILMADSATRALLGSLVVVRTADAVIRWRWAEQKRRLHLSQQLRSGLLTVNEKTKRKKADSDSAHQRTSVGSDHCAIDECGVWKRTLWFVCLLTFLMDIGVRARAFGTHHIAALSPLGYFYADFTDPAMFFKRLQLFVKAVFNSIGLDEIANAVCESLTARSIIDGTTGEHPIIFELVAVVQSSWLWFFYESPAVHVVLLGAFVLTRWLMPAAVRLLRNIRHPAKGPRPTLDARKSDLGDQQGHRGAASDKDCSSWLRRVLPLELFVDIDWVRWIPFVFLLSWAVSLGQAASAVPRALSPLLVMLLHYDRARLLSARFLPAFPTQLKAASNTHLLGDSVTLPVVKPSLEEESERAESGPARNDPMADRSAHESRRIELKDLRNAAQAQLRQYCYQRSVLWSFTEALALFFLSWALFFSEGHQTVLAAIDWNSAFVGMPSYNMLGGGALVVCHTFFPVFLCGFASVLADRQVSDFSFSKQQQQQQQQQQAQQEQIECQQRNTALPMWGLEDHDLALQPSLPHLPCDLNLTDARSCSSEVLKQSAAESDEIDRERNHCVATPHVSIALMYTVIWSIHLGIMTISMARHRRHLMVWEVFAPEFFFAVAMWAVSLVSIPIGHLLLPLEERNTQRSHSQ